MKNFNIIPMYSSRMGIVGIVLGLLSVVAILLKYFHVNLEISRSNLLLGLMISLYLITMSKELKTFANIQPLRYAALRISFTVTMSTIISYLIVVINFGALFTLQSVMLIGFICLLSYLIALYGYILMDGAADQETEFMVNVKRYPRFYISMVILFSIGIILLIILSSI